MSYAGLKFSATTALVFGSLQVAAAEPETLEAVKQSVMTPGIPCPVICRFGFGDWLDHRARCVV